MEQDGAESEAEAGSAVESETVVRSKAHIEFLERIISLEVFVGRKPMTKVLSYNFLE